MIASDVLNRVRVVLQDSGTRWTDSELLLFLSSAQRAVVEIRPAANTILASYNLAAGTRQQLNAAHYRLLDVVRNIDRADNTKIGKAIRFVDRDALNQSDPDWHSSTPTRVVRNWTVDEREPRVFYVYPRAIDTSSTVQALVSVLPPEVTTTGQTLALEDAYMNALENYVLFKAFSKDTEFANPQKAANHLNIFQALMGVKPTSEARASANFNDKGAAPDAATLGGGV